MIIFPPSTSRVAPVTFLIACVEIWDTAGQPVQGLTRGDLHVRQVTSSTILDMPVFLEAKEDYAEACLCRAILSCHPAAYSPRTV